MRSLSLILLLTIGLAACDLYVVGEPWGACGRDLEGNVLCTPGYTCVEGVLGDMCVPPCGPGIAETPESTCEADAPLSIIPLGQEFACTPEHLCIAICDDLTPCGEGQICEGGVCLWP